MGGWKSARTTTSPIHLLVEHYRVISARVTSRAERDTIRQPTPIKRRNRKILMSVESGDLSTEIARRKASYSHAVQTRG